MSTPWVLYAMETAAFEAIRPHLDAAEASVGVGFEFEHLAATPPGDTLIATAKVTAVEGNKVMLDFEARDSHDLVAKGKHVRAVIDQTRFQKRLDRKRGATG
jgi:predicted thioesterase